MIEDFVSSCLESRSSDPLICEVLANHTYNVLLSVFPEHLGFRPDLNPEVSLQSQGHSGSLFPTVQDVGIAKQYTLRPVMNEIIHNDRSFLLLLGDYSSSECSDCEPGCNTISIRQWGFQYLLVDPNEYNIEETALIDIIYVNPIVFMLTGSCNENAERFGGSDAIQSVVSNVLYVVVRAFDDDAYVCLEVSR